MDRTARARPGGLPTLLINLFAVAALCVLILVHAVFDRREAIADAQAEAANLSDALSEHTRQTMAAIDLGLITLAREIGERGGLSDVSLTLLHELLRERQAASPSTLAFYVLDADGWLIGSSERAGMPPVLLSDTPNFRRHLEGPGHGLLLSGPYQGKLDAVTGRWIITASRRLDHPDGSIAGVVGAVVSLDHLLDFYGTLNLGRQGLIALLDADGTLITRSPVLVEELGKQKFDAEQHQRLFAGTHGHFRARYPSDGIERVSGYHYVQGRDLVVLVGFGVDEVLAPWRQRLAVDVVVAGGVIVLFVLSTTLIGRHLTRRREWEHMRMARLEALTEASAQLIGAGDEAEVQTRVADIARELVGAREAIVSLRDPSAPDAYRHVVSPPAPPAGADALAAYICAGKRACCESRDTLVERATWPGEAAARLPQHGWLGAPIVGHDGRDLGAILLFDRADGPFGPLDTAEISQLAGFTGVALERLRSVRHREEALAEIATILSSISDGVAAVDEDWRFTFLNAEAERMLRRSREELIGRNMWEVFPEGVDSPAFDVYRRARAENRMVSAEFHYAPLDTWFSVRAFPHPKGLTIYFQDVTQRIETEEQLRQSQKMDALGKLTGGVAHDFNNLLTVILGNAEALIDRSGPDALPDKLRKPVELIRVAGERAAELTHRLLAFARRQPLDPVETDVNELLQGFDDLLERTLGEHVTVRLERGEPLWPTVVDRNELHNAILNLAINARDAMPDGGVVTIRTANRVVDARQAAEWGLAEGDYVSVSVTDTGEGMPPEVIARAFEPFFTTKPAGKGSGLGLSMVYGFAQQSGGLARIDSRPGAGTAVSVLLPRAGEASAPDGQAHPAVEAPAGRDEHILLLDDDLVRDHTCSCLERLGYRVTACADAASAIERLREGCIYDLLLTDVQLAGPMSGREVARIALEHCAGMKVLYVSGYTENVFVHDGRMESGVCLLGKPFRIDELARRLRELLDA